MSEGLKSQSTDWKKRKGGIIHLAVQITDLLKQMISPDSHENVKELQRLLKDILTAKIITLSKEDGHLSHH
jgi:hypothetical protein